MIKELIKIANELDKRGLMNEADTLDELIDNPHQSPEWQAAESNPEQVALWNQSAYPAGSSAPEDISSKVREALSSPGGQEVLTKYNLTLDDQAIDNLKNAIANFDLKTLTDKLMELTIGVKEAQQFSKAINKRAGVAGGAFDFLAVTIKEIVAIVKYLAGPSKLWMKGLIAAITAAVGTGYLASPIDIIPDFLLGIGQIDDIIVYIKVFAFAASKIDSENWREARGDASEEIPEKAIEDVGSEEDPPPLISELPVIEPAEEAVA